MVWYWTFWFILLALYVWSLGWGLAHAQVVADILAPQGRAPATRIDHARQDVLRQLTASYERGLIDRETYLRRRRALRR